MSNIKWCRRLPDAAIFLHKLQLGRYKHFEVQCHHVETLWTEQKIKLIIVKNNESHDDSNIDSKERVTGLGIKMSTATFTRNESVLVAECSLMLTLLKPHVVLVLEYCKLWYTWRAKIRISYRSYSTSVFIQNHLSTAIKLLGNHALNQIIFSQI